MADIGLNLDVVQFKGYADLQRRLAAVKGVVRDAQLMRQLGTLAVTEQRSMLYHSFTRRTGATGASLAVQSVTPTSAAIYSNKVAKFLDQGTGLYGPAHRKITPKQAKVLAWRTGGGSVLRATGAARKGRAGAGAGWAFARSVRGVKPHPFIVPGAERAIAMSGFADVVIKAWDSAA